MRVRYEFYVIGYFVMPEHIHMLVSEPRKELLSKAIQALKLSVSVQSPERPFWQPRYYDFNVHSQDKPEPGEAWSGRKAGRLAVVELSALRDWRSGYRRDRVLLDAGAQGWARGSHVSKSRHGAPNHLWLVRYGHPPPRFVICALGDLAASPPFAANCDILNCLTFGGQSNPFLCGWSDLGPPFQVEYANTICVSVSHGTPR